MSDPSSNYFGLEPAQCDYRTSRVAVFGVPFEGAISYGAGASRAPAAVLTASQQVELFDHELLATPCDVGIHTVDPEALGTPLGSFGEVRARLDATLPRLLADGKFPVMIGGDHSVMPPAIPHYLAHYPELGLFHVDAHADLRPQYDGNPDSHACAIRRALDYPLAGVVSLGLRNLSWPEWEFLQTQPRIQVVWGGSRMVPDGQWQAEVRAAIARLPAHVYLTIDVDGLDPGIMPATGTPEPGGLSWPQLVFALEELFAEREVVGMDLNELAPIDGLHAPDFLVAKLLYKAVGLKFRRVLAARPVPGPSQP